ncbi:MAG: MGMT family protein [Candidatus Eremiobacteraeota bacterium]|nr:MGMT family protein [Candidatus Eremiobacteraeota bacterium]MBV9647580.1 MGMT family protein [Candidatus Eremiobacteraeota bacterium]
MSKQQHALRPDARIARILTLVRTIPKGFVQTYGDIDETAPRLVGKVLATTAQDVPWHRVVRSDGSVTQGRRQLARLRKEGVPIRRGRVDLRVARWPRGAKLLKC